MSKAETTVLVEKIKGAIDGGMATIAAAATANAAGGKQVETLAGTAAQPTGSCVVQRKPLSIPSAYAALGVTTGYTPRKVGQLRELVLALSAGGKTTYAAGIPDSMILDFEKAAESVPNQRAMRVPIKNGDHLMKIIDKLEADGKANTRPVSRIQFDTFDEMVEVMAVHLGIEYKMADIRNYGSHGAGYNILTGRCIQILKRLEEVGYAWTVYGHLAEKSIVVNGKDKTVIRPVLYDSLFRVVARSAELKAMLSTIGETRQTTRRFQGQDIPGPDVHEVNFYMTIKLSEAMGSMEGGKLRGIPSVDAKIQMPNPLTGLYGWDKFSEYYGEQIEKTKAAVKG